jgi:hypothetical protein
MADDDTTAPVRYDSFTGLNMISVQWLIDYAYFGDVHEDGYEGDPYFKMKCLERNLTECDSGFIASIQEGGVKTPVRFDPETGELINGHHRVVVAWLLGIEEIPYADYGTTDYDLPQSYPGAN